MSLGSLTVMLDHARQHGYMLPYSESWNLESLQAVVEAAEECQSPIIAGFNGGFLRHRTRKKPEDLAYYGCFCEPLRKANVPVAFLLNESDSLAQIGEAIKLGFNAVMPESATLSAPDYERMVGTVVETARPRGVWVEAQIGSLPVGHPEVNNGHGEITDPAEAEAFVEATGVDALAVSVGNVHVLTEGKAELDLELLRRIHQRVPVPLVIHGGTSLTHESYQSLAQVGVGKINFGTMLKQAYLDAIRRSLAKYRRPLSPHDFLGIGGPEDLMAAGKEAVKSEVMRLITLCGSKGRYKNDDYEAGVRTRGKQSI